MLKLLLTSSGISNNSIYQSLVELLGKPVAECNALFIPTAMYPFSSGNYMVWQALCGNLASPLAQLGWKSLGILELTALPTIDERIWVQTVEEADALLVWGGDPIFLAYWLRQSGLAQLLASLNRDLVYVGVSAGSMAASTVFGETYHDAPGGFHDVLKSEDIVFSTQQGEIKRLFQLAKGAGLIDFALIPHFENEKHPDACEPNAQKWAAQIPTQVYAIDDQAAIKVLDKKVEIISEGHWKLFDQK